MKREIRFAITVSSYWPEKKFDGQIIFPVGGTYELKTIEFETDNKDPLRDAISTLREVLNYRSDFHIWYWWWLDLDKGKLW